MVFSSIAFLFYFFPVFLLLYYLLPWKNLVLLVASLVFYAWGEPRFLPLLLTSILLNYVAGLLIARSVESRRAWLLFGIAGNLALLAWFKYSGFFSAAFNDIFAANFALPEVVLPLGISFFTFQGLSYLVDVYRKQVAVQRSLLHFATYSAMFPQLIAGPIVRYSQVATELAERHMPNARVMAGFEQFALGLAQKVLIANTLALPADRLFGADPANLSAPAAWIGLVCYSLQIYYDFCGYSNMAIGIGHMTGFTFPRNFNQPYSARSVTEFWQRWHISLSGWFRDYLYIPLGGNRFGALRTYANLAVVFVLCGLWHGAAWAFIVWGIWHGTLLVIERAGFGAVLARLPRVLAHGWTLLLVMLGWVFFRAADLDLAWRFMLALAGQSALPGGFPWQLALGKTEMAALSAGLLFALPRRSDVALHRWRWQQSSLAIAALALCTVSLAGGTYNPFIYYRF